MSDRYQSVIVSLANDVSAEAAESIMAAICQIRGVNLAERGEPVDSTDYLARQRWAIDTAKFLQSTILAAAFDSQKWQEIKRIIDR